MVKTTLACVIAKCEQFLPYFVPASVSRIPATARLGSSHRMRCLQHRLGDRRDVEIQQEYILDMQANAAQALQSVDFMAIAQETGFENPWLLFDTYLNAVSEECAKLTLPKWQERLGAADIWTAEHCFKLAESLRID